MHKKPNQQSTMNRILAASILSFSLGALIPSTASAALANYTKGHGDIGIAYEGGLWNLHVHLSQFAVLDGIPLAAAQEFSPGDIAIVVPNPTAARPGSSTWIPLGISAGQPFWFLPKSQDVNKPFLGFGTEELDPGDWVGDISLKLTAISGTGVSAGGFFTLWDTDTFGDKTFYWTSADGLGVTDVLTVGAGTHSHNNMAFTKAGTYDITIQAMATHVDDGVIVGSATYRFDVAPIPEPTTATFTGLFCIGVAALRRRRSRPLHA